MHEYILVSDIGKKRDSFALMLFHDNAQIVEGNKTLGTPDRVIHFYNIELIEKHQGLGYEGQADRIASVMKHPELIMNTDLLIDGTGVGDAVVELVRKRGLLPIPIIFSGGNSPIEHHAEFGNIFKDSGAKFSGIQVIDNITVPKKDLVNAGSVIMGQGRIRVAPQRWKEDFEKQLVNFKGKVNERTKKTKYEAETEQVHDDLVVVFLMGSWWILNRKEKGIREQASSQNASTGWEPDEFC
jgi:hypothetical protein